MSQFFTIGDNTLYRRGFPWISGLVEGFREIYYCETENRALRYATGNMVAVLERNKGTQWPDVLGCGEFPFLIVSERVIECWEKEGVGKFPIHQVEIAPPLPKKLALTNLPKYLWIDGKKLKGALVDFEVSGFIGVKFCPECGTRSDNIPQTFKRQYARDAKFSYVFRENTWNGLNLFTTDISGNLFFCTEAVVECARKYKLTNFRFIRIEEGHGIGSKGLKYM